MHDLCRIHKAFRLERQEIDRRRKKRLKPSRYTAKYSRENSDVEANNFELYRQMVRGLLYLSWENLRPSPVLFNGTYCVVNFSLLYS